MRIRFLAAVVCVLLAAGCNGSDSDDQPQAQATTTVAPTTTTKPDPAVEGCKTFYDEPFEAAEMMLISRDARIVEAAKDWKDAEVTSGKFFRAVEEVIAACRAAGYL